MRNTLLVMFWIPDGKSNKGWACWQSSRSVINLPRVGDSVAFDGDFDRRQVVGVVHNLRRERTKPESSVDIFLSEPIPPFFAPTATRSAKAENAEALRKRQVGAGDPA